ncbi:zinc-ribbon domain-containing protein [Flavobacterium sp.]|uniref:zinc-ribbon domain-containing protein n=1 Tax=Flavobacterium sp. TaxID=239 RepID=UPI00286A97F9|nr:zinc-ribbon domain-containing protein [Flavobacterium sp.]
MALVNCSECNTKISDEAKNCPKCGAPVDLEKIKIKKNQTSKGCLMFIVIVIFIAVLVNTCNKTGSENTNSTTETLYPEPIIDTVAEKKLQDSLNKIAEIEEANFKKTKAGKIQKKHPEWSREDCERIANKKIWIGMNYDMLLYLRGKPNDVNTSDYGNGPEYQCCWDDYDPSCFYMKSDDIITSYN